MTSWAASRRRSSCRASSTPSCAPIPARRTKARRSSASTPPPARRSGRTSSTSFSPTCRPSASAGRAASATRTPGLVYAMGVCGYFQCIDGDTGKTLWKRSLNEEFGMLTTYGGRTNVPVVFENLVIISGVIIGWGDMARPAHRFLAFDKKTGETVWFNGTKPLPEDTTYSTPVRPCSRARRRWSSARATAASTPGSRAPASRSGASAFAPRAERLAGRRSRPRVHGPLRRKHRRHQRWAASSAIDGTQNRRHHEERRTVAQPRHGRQELAAVASTAGCTPSTTARRSCTSSTPTTGKLVGKPERMIGTIMRVEPRLCRRQDLRLHDQRLARLPDHREGRQDDPHAATVRRGRSPRLADHFARADLSADRRADVLPGQGGRQASCHGPTQAAARAAAVGKDDEPATVQVVPAEVLMKPGAHQKFTVRLFNDRGQLLEELAGQLHADRPRRNQQGRHVRGRQRTLRTRPRS